MCGDILPTKNTSFSLEFRPKLLEKGCINMDGLFVCCTLLLVVSCESSTTAYKYEITMKTNPEARAVPLYFETTLTCEMSSPPDKHEWKFYPLKLSDVHNPEAEIDLDTFNFQFLSTNSTNKKLSRLNIQVNSSSNAGDYQCLAYYGAEVVASVPWRITIATLGSFPKQVNADLLISPGNTVNWKCEPPKSNPKSYIDYYKNEDLKFSISKQSLTLINVNQTNSGRYKCIFNNIFFPQTDTIANLKLTIDRNAPQQKPFYIVPLKSNYTAVVGDEVLLECSAVGNPVPRTTWRKKVGAIDEKRGKMGAEGLSIQKVEVNDAGVYICDNQNSQGRIRHEISLSVHVPPSINCHEREIEVKQNSSHSLECLVGGVPAPKISWFLNGFSVKNDSKIRSWGNKIAFEGIEKTHAGNLQVFARNVVKTVYRIVSLKVIPITWNSFQPPTKSRMGNKKNRLRPKQPKIFISKPTISRMNEQAVMVRWSVPANSDLIQFFKVQYREFKTSNGSAVWQTLDTQNDIPNHTTIYEVNNLKPDHFYKFRVAVVYRNNDHNFSAISDKFYLKRDDFDNVNKLPVPLITHTEAVNSTAVRIYWTVESGNASVVGFYVNYNAADSAADYMKAPVDGQNATFYVLDNLLPDTVYDIKMQSFTLKAASEFSATTKVKTAGKTPVTVAVPTSEPTPTPTESSAISKLYIIIATGVIVGGGCILLAIALLIVCRKWKQKKNNNRGERDKSGVGAEEHHIQVEGSDYVVSQKSSLPRTNGCPTNRITITPNPLADADNKKFLARIFSRVRT